MNESNKESGSMPVIIAIILFIVTVVLLVIWGVKNETEYIETNMLFAIKYILMSIVINVLLGYIYI